MRKQSQEVLVIHFRHCSEQKQGWEVHSTSQERWMKTFWNMILCLSVMAPRGVAQLQISVFWRRCRLSSVSYSESRNLLFWSRLPNPTFNQIAPLSVPYSRGIYTISHDPVSYSDIRVGICGVFVAYAWQQILEDLCCVRMIRVKGKAFSHADADS